MARPNKIWFRAATGWWMVTINGIKEKLAKGQENRALAEQKFHGLMAARAQLPESPAARVADMIEAFLAWSAAHQPEETRYCYRFYGQKFAERWGYLRASELKPFHVTRWVDEHTWSETTQFNARRAIFRVFSWAESEGLVNRNPLRGMKRPKPSPRERALTPEEFEAMYRASDQFFGRFLFALRETGARPKELRLLRWTQVRADRLVLSEHKTKRKTKKPRIIYLSTAMQKLMEELRAESQSEFVFVNARGRPWTVSAVCLRVQRLKKKLGLKCDVCAYLARHFFGTNAIVNGVDIATVAELMGHSSLEMISTVYVHLADQHSHMQEAIEKATRPLVSSTPPTDVRRSSA